MAAVGISVWCLLITFIAPDLGRYGLVISKLATFGVGGENSLGAWWSGMLLLIVGIHSLDGFYRHRDRRRIAYAWLCLGLLMCLLSMDEVSSLHERIIGGTNGFVVLCAAGGIFVIR